MTITERKLKLVILTYLTGHYFIFFQEEKVAGDLGCLLDGTVACFIY